MRHVMIGMPMHGRQVDAETMLMLLSAQTLLHSRGWLMTVQIGFGTHAIHTARNMIVQRFLDSDCTDLFFIDDDISGDPTYVTHLLDYPVDVVAGLYPQKNDKDDFVIDPFYVDGKPQPFERDVVTGLIKHSGCGVGFTRISRDAILKMLDYIKTNYPLCWYRERGHPDMEIWPVFDIVHIEHTTVHEDIWFFKMWNAMGGTSWADPDVVLTHAGRKAYRGCAAQRLNLAVTRPAAA
jgi:hypothetical protein